MAKNQRHDKNCYAENQQNNFEPVRTIDNTHRVGSGLKSGADETRRDHKGSLFAAVNFQVPVRMIGHLENQGGRVWRMHNRRVPARTDSLAEYLPTQIPWVKRR